MSKRLILILALAFVVGITFAAYAEVQNVKVSGDITVQGVGRDNFDLAKTQSEGVLTTTNYSDTDRDILSIARVRVDADLTDNVMATVRLLNERTWNGEGQNMGNTNRNIGWNGAIGAVGDQNEIDLDLAYVTLKEFLYSPLTLTIGRQELHYGNELIVGDPDTNLWSAATNLAEGDLSARKSFDAVRATLDYNPLVVDAVFAKIQEAVANLNDDITLSGINASYALNKNTTLEGYFFSKVKGVNAPSVRNLDRASALGWIDSANGNGTVFLNQNPLFKDKTDIVNVVGVRAVDKTVNNLTLDGQVAWQFGTYNPKFDPNARFDATGTSYPYHKARTTKRNAWAAQLMAAYDLKDIAMVSKWNPVISGSYTYFTGANRDQTTQRSYKGWDPMFENQTVGHIMNAILADTNMHRGSVSAKAKFTDDITAKLDYVNAWFARRFPRDEVRQVVLSGVATNGATARAFVMGNGKYIGQEIDATLTYDYTEDVQFSLLGGIFLVGNNIRDLDHPTGKGNRADAAELIGSMKVTF